MHNGDMATHTHDLFNEDKAAWLQDLQEDRLCLVLHSASATLLQETSHTLETLWLQGQAGQVESFDGAHCQDIVRRFNELVAAYSASVAAHPPDPEHPAHLWLVHQAQSLTADQIQLLGQMLVHLPGVNIRLILLHEGSAPGSNWKDATEGKADIHELLPPPPPIMDLLDFAAEANNDLSPSEQPAAPKGKAALDRRHWLMAGAFGVAVFALGFAAGRLSSPVPQSTQAVVADVSHMPAPTEPASSVVTTTATPAPTNKQAPTTPPAVNTPPVPPKDMLLGADMQWLRRLPPNSFVVAHNSFADLAAAQAFKGKKAILKTARIVPVQTGNKTVYLVISGPFRSEERTRGFMSRLEWKKAARVLPRQSVIDEMDKALGT